jgi:hypothetical protein
LRPSGRMIGGGTASVSPMPDTSVPGWPKSRRAGRDVALFVTYYNIVRIP